MSVPVAMPKIGLTIEEAEVTEWLRAVGDPVTEGEPLVVVNADKSDVVIDAPASGTLQQVLADVGAVVAIGAHLALIGSVDEPGATPTPESPPPIPPPDPPPVVADSGRPPGAARTGAPAPEARSAARRVVSPYARRLARERGVDLTTVAGTGPSGRVVARDVPHADRSVTGPTGAGGAVATLSASADAVELIAVTISHRRVHLVHLLAWATARAVERRHPEWFTDGCLDVDVHRSDGTTARARWYRELTFLTWCDRVDEGAPAVEDPAASVRVVDLAVDHVEPGGFPHPPPSPFTVVCSGLRSSTRVSDGALVTRPRLPLVATYDPVALPPAAAGRLLAAIADRMARVGEVLDELPHRWQAGTA